MFTLESTVSISSPPYIGDTECGSSTSRGTLGAYKVVFDCFSTSGGSIGWDIYQVDASNAVVSHDETNGAPGNTCGTGFIYTHAFLPGAHHVSIVAHLDGAHADWSGEFRTYYGDVVDYCAYGTRLKAGLQNTAVVSEVGIAALAERFPALKWLEIGWGGIIGWTWVPGNVCNGPPDPMPTFTDDDFIQGTQIPSPGSLDKWFKAYQIANWPVFCECIPAPTGGPPPVTEPDPSTSRPAHAPDPPAPIGCSNDDICATLDQIVKQLNSLSAVVAYIRQDVVLIQRQGVPFAYVPGTAHSALSGSGDFAVSSILGLAVTFTTLPPSFPAAPGDPDTYHQIGKVSIGTSDGWERSWMPTHSPYLIFPIAGAITRVGYLFPTGIVATITELLREP